MSAFSRFEKSGSAVTELGVDVSPLVQRCRDRDHIAFPRSFPHLIVQVLFRILRNHSQPGEQCKQEKA
jgi:hypothetical protein